MKRIKIFFLVIVILMIFFVTMSCSNTNAPDTIFIKGDWPYYDSYSDLCAASSLVIEGKVLSILYSVIDYKYGKLVDDCKNDLDNKMLYTIYTVEVEKLLNGDAGQTINLVIMGGRDDRDLALQKKLLDTSGLSKKFDSIPVLSESKAKLAEGDICMFCLHKFGDFYSPINIEQYAFPRGSSDYTKIKEYLITDN